MDDVKIGEILLPGDDDTQGRQERQVRARFWPTLKRAVRQIPFSRDLVAAYYCAVDPRTPTRVRGVLLAALAYFVLPIDFVPDFFALVGFSDDIAVLAAAFRMIQGHIADRHYEAADLALADNPDMAAGASSR
ncbi:YkvA family protein [Rhizobium terrae]|uniref:YkvA family protein n=1 Tax=Rhizobium terrae TaxID=2171756 RepID=UPI000E3DC58A|nr:YkvA family protein [Rhizobium terrae]